MFDISDRKRVQARVLELAASDGRVVAGAVVGSLAASQGDRWSDLDLTFAVADGESLPAVLDDWSNTLIEEFAAVRLFDLPSGPSIYRVFLLPGCLQFDLSFTPAAYFGASGPNFRLLFGSAVERPYIQPQSAHELLGYAVHHALRARFCIERGRLWQAEYWISSLRDNALSLACRRRGLPTHYARGFDDLPLPVRDTFEEAIVRSLDRDELLRALRCAVKNLLHEGQEARDLAAKVAPHLQQLVVDWEDGGDEQADETAAQG